MKIALIIPSYNEEITIAKTIRSFHEVNSNIEIWVIDNNSKDKTQQIARDTLQSLGAKGGVLFEPMQGKAEAVRTAFHKIEADYYGIVDADSTYPASDFNKLLDAIVGKNVDMVVGDRHSSGDYQKINSRPFHNVGNKTVTFLINTLFKADLKDIMSGYRVFSRRFIKNYPILCLGFEIETEMSIHALHKKFKIVEIPISYVSRPEGSHSKLNTYVDGFKIIKTIFWIFKDYYPLKFFGYISLFGAFLGLLAGYPVVTEFIEKGTIAHIPLAILSTGIMIFSIVLAAVGFILDTVVEIQRFNFELKLLQENRN